jgi:hypothetical protein
MIGVGFRLLDVKLREEGSRPSLGVGGDLEAIFKEKKNRTTWLLAICVSASYRCRSPATRLSLRTLKIASTEPVTDAERWPASFVRKYHIQQADADAKLTVLWGAGGGALCAVVGCRGLSLSSVSSCRFSSLVGCSRE